MPRPIRLALLLLDRPRPAPQSAQAAKRPDGWKVRLDDPGPDSTKLVFAAMAPGWHVTTGPSVILYNPATTAKGAYKAESNIQPLQAGGAGTPRRSACSSAAPTSTQRTSPTPTSSSGMTASTW